MHFLLCLDFITFYIFIVLFSFSNPTVLFACIILPPMVLCNAYGAHFPPDGASSVSSDEGGVSGVFGAHPGPLLEQQAPVHHQVSGLTDGHPGGRPVPRVSESGSQPRPTRPLPQGAGHPHKQPTCQGTHLVSQS